MHRSSRTPVRSLRAFLLRRSGAALLALAYLLVAGVYIWLSTEAARQWTRRDADLWLWVEVLKGWGFVLLTAVGLYALLRVVVRAARTQEEVTQELLQAHQRLKLLVEGNPHFFFYTQDLAGNVTYISPTVEHITGRPVEQWLGQRHWFVTDNPINEEARRRTRDHLAGRFDGRPVLVEIAHPSGRRVLVEAYEAPLMVGGQQVGIQGVAHDVTSRRRGELLREFFLKVSQSAAEAKTLELLLGEVHRALGLLLPAENFYVALWDGSGPEIRFPYFVDEKDRPPEPRPPGRGLTEYVIRTGRPALFGPEEKARLAAAGEVAPVGSPSVSWMGAPLQVGMKTLGAMVVQSYREDLRFFPEDLEVLSLAARQVAQALHRFQLQRELEEAAARFRSVVELSPDAILIHQDGVIRFANPAAARLWGARGPEELVGKPALELVAPSFRPVVQERVRRALTEHRNAPPLVEEFVRLDGSTFRGEATAAPIFYEGRPAMEVVIRDVSERERVEAMVRQAQKLEAIGALAGGVAHDFNNLLQACSGVLFALRAEAGSGASVEPHIERLEQLVQRGAALARQLLLFARREVTKLEVLDLNEVVREVAQLLDRLLPENIRCRLELASDPAYVEGDLGQLQQVVLNLVLNARDAMPEGGNLWVRTAVQGEEVVLAVVDTGHGIPEEIRDRIFEPFFTTKGPEKGTGLGLAVVHGIVTSHRGRIEVASEIGRGSTFRVFFPRVAGEPQGRPRPATEERLPQGRGRRILLVEDDEVARETLAQVLQSLGYQVTAVGSAEEAGTLPVEPAFDLLLTDFLLPGASGAQLAAGLVERWPQLKVVAMSGYAQDQVFKEQVLAGKLRFLQKPFTVERLARELAAALEEETLEEKV